MVSTTDSEERRFKYPFDEPLLFWREVAMQAFSHSAIVADDRLIVPEEGQERPLSFGDDIRVDDGEGEGSLKPFPFNLRSHVPHLSGILLGRHPSLHYEVHLFSCATR